MRAGKRAQDSKSGNSSVPCNMQSIDNIFLVYEVNKLIAH